MWAYAIYKQFNGNDKIILLASPPNEYVKCFTDENMCVSAAN